MTLFEMTADDKIPVGSVPADNDVIRRLVKAGFDLNHVRTVFDSLAPKLPTFGYAKGSSPHLMKSPPDPIPDRSGEFWPIFSDRAYDLLLTLGLPPRDFYPCRYDVTGDRPFHIHLPYKTFDIVDVEKTKFRMVLDTSPPLRHGIVELSLLDNLPRLPQCFRANAPGFNAVFSEVFVLRELKEQWERSGFVDASFRQMS